MKTSLRRMLALLCCILFCAILLPQPAAAVTLTAVNDTLLPLSDGTMPTRRNGETYAPYTVFSSFGVSSSYSGGILSMSYGGNSLSFSPSEGYVYDQNANSYSSPAYQINGTVYVPVRLVCGRFGLGYSTFSAFGETVLRITSGSAQSDASFSSAASEQIRTAINSYYGTPSSPPPTTGGNGSTPSVTPSPPQTTPSAPTTQTTVKQPSRIYLAFFGPTNERTAEVLTALQESRRQGTFFLPVDTTAWNQDTIRRIAAEGHTIGLLLYASETASSEEMTAQLTLANERLLAILGIQTRLVSNAGGCSIWTTAQRQALIDAGYRLWDFTIDSGDEGMSASAAADALSLAFAATDDAVVLRFRSTENTAALIGGVSDYMLSSRIPIGVITLTVPPINGANDTR